MAYQEKPDESQIADTIAMECKEPGWVRCKCGYRFFYVVETGAIVLIAYCPKCKDTYRFLIGMPISLT